MKKYIKIKFDEYVDWNSVKKIVNKTFLKELKGIDECDIFLEIILEGEIPRFGNRISTDSILAGIPAKQYSNIRVILLNNIFIFNNFFETFNNLDVVILDTCNIRSPKEECNINSKYFICDDIYKSCDFEYNKKISLLSIMKFDNSDKDLLKCLNCDDFFQEFINKYNCKFLYDRSEDQIENQTTLNLTMDFLLDIFNNSNIAIPLLISNYSDKSIKIDKLYDKLNIVLDITIDDFENMADININNNVKVIFHIKYPSIFYRISIDNLFDYFQKYNHEKIKLDFLSGIFSNSLIPTYKFILSYYIRFGNLDKLDWKDPSDKNNYVKNYNYFKGKSDELKSNHLYKYMFCKILENKFNFISILD